MTSDKLENLVRTGLLKQEPPPPDLVGLKQPGLSRLAYAEHNDLAFESRFDLAYNAAHALALCALRRTGYRSEKRYLVFQTLAETAGLAAGHWGVLTKAHKSAISPSTKATWSRTRAFSLTISRRRGLWLCS